MANKMITVKYFDSDTIDSRFLAAEAYGLEIKAAEPTGEPDEIFLTVFGPAENVDRFVEDNAEGDLEPFEAQRDLSDNEYLSWLSKELARFGVLFVPKFIDEDDENEEDDNV